MISLRKPGRSDIEQFIAQQSQEPFNYPFVGRSRTDPPATFDIDHNRIQIGRGRADFEAGCAALARWQMFDLGWVHLCWPDSPLQEGTTVAILIHIFGVWWLNASRIVYLIDETEPVRRFGFAYGTLTDHAEKGEERFSVEWREDDTVWYDLLAFSRPHHPLAKIGRPLARQIQKRFAKDSLAAMMRFT